METQPQKVQHKHATEKTEGPYYDLPLGARFELVCKCGCRKNEVVIGGTHLWSPWKFPKDGESK